MGLVFATCAVWVKSASLSHGIISCNSGLALPGSEGIVGKMSKQ